MAQEGEHLLYPAPDDFEVSSAEITAITTRKVVAALACEADEASVEEKEWLREEL